MCVLYPRTETVNTSINSFVVCNSACAFLTAVVCSSACAFLLRMRPCTKCHEFVFFHRYNPLHLHPVPLDASDSDERLHRAGHNLLRLRDGAQRVHLAKGEDERGEGARAAPARADGAPQLLPQHSGAVAAADEPLPREQLQPQLRALAGTPRQRSVRGEAVDDDAADGGEFESDAGQSELDEDVASQGGQRERQPRDAERGGD